jgi:hypothetical protein
MGRAYTHTYAHTRTHTHMGPHTSTHTCLLLQLLHVLSLPERLLVMHGLPLTCIALAALLTSCCVDARTGAPPPLSAPPAASPPDALRALARESAAGCSCKLSLLLRHGCCCCCCCCCNTAAAATRLLLLRAEVFDWIGCYRCSCSCCHSSTAAASSCLLQAVLTRGLDNRSSITDAAVLSISQRISLQAAAGVCVALQTRSSRSYSLTRVAMLKRSGPVEVRLSLTNVTCMQCTIVVDWMLAAALERQASTCYASARTAGTCLNERQQSVDNHPPHLHYNSIREHSPRKLTCACSNSTTAVADAEHSVPLAAAAC